MIASRLREPRPTRPSTTVTVDSLTLVAGNLQLVAVTDVTPARALAGVRSLRDDERDARYRLPAGDAQSVRARLLRRPVFAVPPRARAGPSTPQPDRRL